MNAPYTLRPAIPSDYSSIASWVTDAHSCARWAGPNLSFPFDPADLAALLDNPGAQSYVLTNPQSALLGFGQYRVRVPGSAHLGRIIIAAGMRGHGLGWELCSRLICKAIEHYRAERVTLRVYRDNASAQALYRSLGFAPVSDESNDETIFMQVAATHVLSIVSEA